MSTASPDREPSVDAVRRAALELLESLPERPQRMRVRAADVVVDLEWRPAADPASAPARAPEAAPPVTVAALHIEQTVGAPAPPADVHHVCAPTIGTFYHAREPGAAPFVSEGDVVHPGQQIGIVEAMKLMMPVEADRRGRVVAVLVKDGQPVEYGEQLLALGPADAE
jgi:acetyl-CoA carboxylase biotin carboxyl carrier protein